ncbi:transcription factor [Fomitiporia mediterranea MF3/22]|uniref:transcription factor n=1 Tax=Fomitiporia mediterranea (strain MF3/22) TaxID=694068 RepID=UPI0004409842|nr:transcription factor [Fomitiporia mediterranea MF3/22]EJD02975.1 transcription factor [Fomitiporia mediterranea MF3/22]
MASEVASTVQTVGTKDREDEEYIRRNRRKALKELNLGNHGEVSSKNLDSSLKRHTALIKRMRQSIGTENNEQIMKDITSLSLEKYIDELASAAHEGIARCKTERDVWSAVEIISALHRRFPKGFTPAINALLSTALLPPQRTVVSSIGTQNPASTPAGNVAGTASNATITPEQKEKEDAARVTRQRPVLRVCAELALVGIIRDAPGKSGGEWMMKTLKDLLSNDPTLSSLPLLTTFLKSYARPFLGITPSTGSKAQIPEGTTTDLVAAVARQNADGFPQLGTDGEEDELVEKETRARFKRMCEGYFESVSKKLVIEHKRLQEQDRKNHEAYIRSGEIFEDRQQSYEKMTKSYEKLLSSCQTLSELLNLPMPTLPAATQKNDTIIVSAAGQQTTQEEIYVIGGKWEDEEERRFYEDIQDLRDFVPKSVLGLDETDGQQPDEKSGLNKTKDEELEKEKKRQEEKEARELEKELKRLELGHEAKDETRNDNAPDEVEMEDDSAVTPVPSPPKSPSPPQSPSLAPQGPSQLLTALLARLPDCTNRTLIDSAAVEFAFLNSKAARKRLVKFMTQVPKNRTDLLPHYSRLVATLHKYMPDVSADLIASLEEEFRYLQRKKNVVKEFAETRQKNIAFISCLTKFGVVPTHVILHIFKVCLDDFSGVNIDNLAMLLEGCGRYLLRSDETKDRFVTMIELMRRKQSMQHLDPRQTLMLENAYYQCNPPERAPIKEKERTPMELFIRHLVYDVLTKKTIDKVLKLIRKLNWDDAQVVRALHNAFTRPWKIKYSNISLLAMLVYDLQRYHPEFSVAVVDQVLENVRRGMETNAYRENQQRVATIKYLGELYTYRVISSSIIFDTLWSLVTFGHPEGRPLPGQACPLDMPDDFFRIRLVCVLLDTCGMCFDKGSQKKKLDNFMIFFQLYVFTKENLPMEVEFMLEDTLEALRPKMNKLKDFEEAAHAVDELFTQILHTNVNDAEGEDSGEESDEDREGDDRVGSEEDEDDDQTVSESMTNERPPSPDTLVLLNAPENLGPTDEDENEFAKELAKMVTDSAAEARKVDKRTAQALWDSATMPSGFRKKKYDNSDEDGDVSDDGESENQETMKFVVLTKKGNKQQAKKIAIPANTALAAQTRNAQLQDKVEQQHLKKLVLDYEQREEVEEFKGRSLESRTRNGAIKIRYVG